MTSLYEKLATATAGTERDGRMNQDAPPELIEADWARQTPAGLFLTPQGRAQLDQSHPARSAPSKQQFDWGRHPYPDPVPEIPTLEDIKAHRQYWILGPGHDTASRTPCGHPGGYYLTDSCPRCEASYGFQVWPTVEELHECPALVVVLGETTTCQGNLDAYPEEWVVAVDDPEFAGSSAAELGQNVAHTPLTVRLRDGRPVVMAPDAALLGELGEFHRGDILAVAATYGTSAYAVLTPEDSATEFHGLPAPEDLHKEGWLSY